MVLGLALWRGPLELRLLIGYAGLCLGLALARPQVNLTLPQWPILLHGPLGGRYFMLPVVALVMSMLWVTSRCSGIGRVALGGAWCAVFLAGAVTHWTYPPYTDLHPSAQADRLAHAAPGTDVALPINPPGWAMVLHRH